MKAARALSLLAALLAVAAAVSPAGQKIETKDGLRLVHNEKGGLWGKAPRISLVPVRTIGDVDAEDENVAFYIPSDMAVDSAGAIYVLDTNNHRIQKFDKDGKYVKTIGRQGQGPGEFYFPNSLEIDARDRIYVSDMNQRIAVLDPEGKEEKTIRLDEGGAGEIALLKSGEIALGQGRMMFRKGPGGPATVELPTKLIRIIDQDGKVVRQVGDATAIKDELLHNSLNRVVFAPDGAGGLLVAFLAQNRIDKVGPDGKTLWRADRELNYGMDVIDKGSIKQSGGGVSVSAPQVNQASVAVAADDKGRAWVVTFDRQLKKEEHVGINMSMSMGPAGRTMSQKVSGNTDIRETDAYKIEIYGPDGILLGEIPLKMFAEGIYIFGDRLFIFDKLRGAKLYEFKIKE